MFDLNQVSANAAGLCHEIIMMEHEGAYRRNSMAVILGARLSIDGNKWCALYGDNLQDGVVGFGDSPAEAYADFDKNWCAKLPLPDVGGTK